VVWRKLCEMCDEKLDRTGQFDLHSDMNCTWVEWKNHGRWKYCRGMALTAGPEERMFFLKYPWFLLPKCWYKPTPEWGKLVDDFMGSLCILSRDECAMLDYLFYLRGMKAGHYHYNSRRVSLENEPEFDEFDIGPKLSSLFFNK